MELFWENRWKKIVKINLSSGFYFVIVPIRSFIYIQSENKSKSEYLECLKISYHYENISTEYSVIV